MTRDRLDIDEHIPTGAKWAEQDADADRAVDARLQEPVDLRVMEHKAAVEYVNDHLDALTQRCLRLVEQKHELRRCLLGLQSLINVEPSLRQSAAWHRAMTEVQRVLDETR